MHNPPPAVVIGIIIAVLALSATAYVKRDALTQFVKRRMKWPGHKEPLRVVEVPGAKGMVA